MLLNTKIAVIGGSGKSGQLLVRELTQQNIPFRLLVRNTASYYLPHGVFVEGDVRDIHAVLKLVEDCTTIISTLGQPKGQPPVFSQATRNVLLAMERANINRHILTTGRLFIVYLLSFNMHQEFESPEELRDTIKCFWYDSKDYGDQLSSFEVMPDGYAEIIFHFGSGCSVSHDGNIQPLPSPFMMGLLNHPVNFYAKKRLPIIGVRCFPWTVFDLLGLSSGKDDVRLFEHPIAQLHAELSGFVEGGDIEGAVRLLTKRLVEIRANVKADSMLSKAGAAMRKANGTIPVSEVAAAAHATVRTLERNFKESSGHTVKDVSALIRFEQVRNHLWTNPEVNLAGLAHDLGYTDQSHLSREFKRFTGTTPAAFARKAKKGKRIVSGDFVAFVQS